MQITLYVSLPHSAGAMMTTTPCPTYGAPDSWHAEYEHDIWWFCSPTGVKLGRIAGAGVLMVKDKRSREEVPLTIDDVLRVTTTIADMR